MPRLVGRHEELRVLRAQSEGAIEAMRAVLVSGDVGIGKSALCEELLSGLAAEGRLILRARCAPPLPEMPEPLQALRIAITTITAIPEWAPLFQAILGRWPELELVTPAASRQPDGGLDQRARLGAGWRKLVALVAERARLVLFLDDVHWADPSTLDQVGQLLVHRARSPVLVLLAARTDEGRLAGELAQWRRSPVFEELCLGPLTPTELEDVLDDPERTRPPLGPGELRQVVEAAGGNPLLALELADAAAAGSPSTPALVQDLALDAYRRLTTPAARVVRAASVAEGPVHVDTLAVVTGLAPAEHELGLGEAVRQHVLELDDVGDQVRFRSPMLRHAVREWVPERQVLHRRYAEVLAGIASPGRLAGIASPGRLASIASPGRLAGIASPGRLASIASPERLAGIASPAPTSLAEQARHWLAAGVEEAALVAFRRAAAGSLPTDPALALALGCAAIDAWHAVAPDSRPSLPVDEIDLQLLCADAAEAVGDVERSVAALRRARLLTADLPDLARRVQVLWRVTQGLVDAGHVDEAVDVSAEALRFAGGLGPAQWARALAERARVLAARHDAVASELVAMAMEAGEGAGRENPRPPVAALSARISAAMVMFDAGDVEEADSLLSATAEVAERHNMAELACRALERLAAHRLRVGDLAGSADVAGRGERLARRHLLPAHLRRLRHWLVRAEIARSESKARVADLLADPEENDPCLRYVRGLGAGRFVSFSQALAHVEALLLVTCPPELRDDAEVLLAELLIASGRSEPAWRVLQDWLERPRTWWRELGVPYACALAVRALSELSEPSEPSEPSELNQGSARSRRPLLDDIAVLEQRASAAVARAAGAGRDLPVAVRAATELLHAELERGRGHHDAGSWSRTAELFATAGDPFTATSCALAGAVSAFEAGQRDGGEQGLAAVRDRAVAHGWQPLVDQAAELARRHHVVTAAATSGEQLRLAPEEKALLALLLEGCTNQEIATRLIISAKTAEARVSRLLRALGVANRTQAAALAVRQGLV